MFNAVKAAQVISYLALKTPGRSLDVIKAIKLVYLSDRESIKRWGNPILNERRVSMPHGPVNSDTYSHVNGEVDLEACGWAEFLDDRANHVIAVKPDVTEDDLDELSEADIIALDEVWRNFGHMGKWQLRDWTHVKANVPEWEDPNNGSQTIPLDRIMTMVGLDNVEERAQMVEDHRRVAGIIHQLSY